MGRIFVTDSDNPTSAFAYVGCFGFVAGKPNRELLENKPEGFAIITPQNEAWATLIEEVYPNAKKVTRYAIKKDTKFDTVALKKNVDMLPNGYKIKEIDSDSVKIDSKEDLKLCLTNIPTTDEKSDISQITNELNKACIRTNDNIKSNLTSNIDLSIPREELNHINGDIILLEKLKKNITEKRLIY